MMEAMLDMNDGACSEQVYRLFQPIDFTCLQTIKAWSMMRVMMLNMGASYTERIFKYISALFLFYGLYSLHFLLLFLRFSASGFTKSIYTLVLFDQLCVISFVFPCLIEGAESQLEGEHIRYRLM